MAFPTSFLATLLLGLVACSAGDAPATRPRLDVAVAANFAGCAAVLAREFERAENCEVVLTSGSTGRLAKQIVEGAPFAVFLAADVEHPEMIVGRGLGDSASRFRYARGVLVLAVPAGRAPPACIEDFRIEPGRRLAIARPALAPYGRAAVEVLASLGLDPELVYGENVGQVVHYLVTAAVDHAFVPLSLARARGLPHLIVPEDRHRPIEQEALLIAPDSVLGRRFLAFLKGDRAHRLIIESGYLPG